MTMGLRYVTSSHPLNGALVCRVFKSCRLHGCFCACVMPLPSIVQVREYLHLLSARRGVNPSVGYIVFRYLSRKAIVK